MASPHRSAAQDGSTRRQDSASRDPGNRNRRAAFRNRYGAAGRRPEIQRCVARVPPRPAPAAAGSCSRYPAREEPSSDRSAFSAVLFCSFRKLRLARRGRVRCGAMPATCFRQCLRAGQCKRRIREARCERRKPRPAVHKAEEIVRQRMGPAFVMLSEKLRFVSSHVYLHRTFALARLAGEAEIQRFMHLLVLPLVWQSIALHQFPQQVCATARGVLFVACCHVAGAHRAAVRLAARTYANAAHRCV